ncbi:ECM29 [Mytilus edulis]|uniref:ECM29 n=1 Tax=Mytilus edulis TaxID=6550 RepID=A0A8S3U047_MYTED|nr:ECM29 [Mytilus edulis]
MVIRQYVVMLCVADTHFIDKDTENDDLVTYGFNKCKGLKICSHNVNRLECKFDEIRYNLMSTPNPPDIIGYCETFLGKNTSDREIDIPGYILQRKDRQSDGGGGWSVYLTETTSFSRKNDFEISNIETMWFEKYYNDMIKDSKDSKTLWKCIHSLNPSNPSKPHELITTGDHKTTDHKEIANTFNNYFTSCVEKLRHSRAPINSNFNTLTNYVQMKFLKKRHNKFIIPPVKVSELFAEITKLDVKTSSGSDNIGPKILKLSAPFIASSLTYIFNRMIDTGIYPSVLKNAKVAPIFKSGEKNVIFDCLYGQSTNAKLKNMAVQFVHHVCLNCADNKFTPVAPVLLSGMVKLIGEATDMILYLHMCLSQDSGQIPDMESLATMQTQAPGIAKYIRDNLQGDNSIQTYFDFIKTLLSAVSGKKNNKTI